MSLVVRAVPSNSTTPDAGSAVVENGSESESEDSNTNTSSDPGLGGYVGLVLTAIVALILMYFILSTCKRRRARKNQAELLQHTGTSFSMEEVNSMTGLKGAGTSRFALGGIMGF